MLSCLLLCTSCWTNILVAGLQRRHASNVMSFKKLVFSYTWCSVPEHTVPMYSLHLGWQKTIGYSSALERLYKIWFPAVKHYWFLWKLLFTKINYSISWDYVLIHKRHPYLTIGGTLRVKFPDKLQPVFIHLSEDFITIEMGNHILSAAISSI